MKTVLEICSVCLLLICISAIIVCGVFLVKNSSQSNTVKYEIQLSVVPDSLGMLQKDVYTVVDSLQTYIQISEQRIADKYEYFLEQKNEENILFSIGSLLCGVFVSILGFFGYKSFKDIETNAEKSAGEIANKATEEYLKNNFPRCVDSKLSVMLNNLTNTVETIVQERVNSGVSAAMEEIKEDVDLLNMYVNGQNSLNQDTVEQGEAENLFG